MSEGREFSAIEHAAQILAQSIMNDKEIGKVCDRIAREMSGTRYWASDTFEQSEDTAQYDLYWSVYAAVQSKITALAAVKLVGAF